MRLLTRIATIGAWWRSGSEGRRLRRRVPRRRRVSSGMRTSTTTLRARNTIAAFDRHPDGTLTPTKGLSVRRLVVLGPDKESGLRAHSRWPITGSTSVAVDAGSNQVSVLRIKADGGLRAIPGGPVASGGTEPVSIAVRPDESANTASTTMTTSSWCTSPTPAMVAATTLAFLWTIPAAFGPSPALPLAFPTGLNLATSCSTGTAHVSPRREWAPPRSTASPSTSEDISPWRPGRRTPRRSWTIRQRASVPPTRTNCFVSNAHDGPGKGTVSAFKVSSNGTLTSIGSPLPGTGRPPRAGLRSRTNGRFCSAVNTALPSTSGYSIRSEWVDAAARQHTVQPPCRSRTSRCAAPPNGKTLMVVDGGGRSVSAPSWSTAEPHRVPSSPTQLPSGAAPFGVVVT